MPDLLILSTSSNLPIFNQVVIVVINFTVIALLITVINHNKLRDMRSRLFVLMGVFMLLWVDFAYLARQVGSESLALSELFLRIAWVATPLLFYCTYLTSIYVINQADRYARLSKILLGVVLTLSFLTAFTDMIIAGVDFVGNDLDIIYGVGFYPFLLAIFAIMLATLIPLSRATLSKTSLVFLVGVIIFYVANAMFNIAFPAFFNVTHLYYIGDYSTIFLLGFTAYAIIKHGLFDIKIIATEAITILLWIVLFSKLFMSQSITETLVDGFVLVVVVVFGIFLIRSVVREVEQRQKLQELTDKLQALHKQKDEFISMAAHELRAPLTAVKGYVSMLVEGDAGELPEKARGFLADTGAVTDRMIRLVNNMLNVARIEGGRIVFQMEETSVIKAVQESYYSFRFEAERKGIDLNLSVPDGVNGDVYADPDRLREVVGNFVSNAIKYTEKGSVEIKISQPIDQWVKVEVIDTGPGITEAEQKKLFQKFYRAESTAGKTIGTGLGLYISRLYVEHFKGKIGISSKVDQGSDFWFELPISTKGKTGE